MFVLACSCGGQQSFHKNDLRPYVVSERDYARGYAKPGEYSAQPKTVPSAKAEKRFASTSLLGI